jgi:hypothetical protein
MAKKELNEDLNRFQELFGYSPEKGVILERKKRVSYQDFADEDEEGGEEIAFGDEGAEASEEGGEENPDFDFGDEGSPEGEEGAFGGEEEAFGDEGGEGEEEVDEFGTASEFSAADELEAEEGDVEEIDVTAIVDKSEEASELARQAVSVGQENSEFLKSLTDKLSNLEAQLTKMDTIASKIGKLEQDIKTPEEKLELRSLDSYPFNLKLTDYWEEKASQNDNYDIVGASGKQQPKEFTISKDDVDDYNEAEIENSFNPEAEGEDVTIWKRKKQY